MALLRDRLVRYGALCAAIPAASAQAGIVYQTGLDIFVSPGGVAFIDFGAGFGEVFDFQVRTGGLPTTTYSYRNSAGPAFYAGLFQFNPGNGNGVSGGGFVAGTSASGGAFDDPARLASGAVIGTAAAFYEPMTSFFGTSHRLDFQFGSAVRSGSSDAGLSNWSTNKRGYLGFKMLKGGSFHFGWFDVETLGWSGFGRAVGPSIIIHGWAFQDEPRLPIRAGDVPAPAAGGLVALALGAAGIRRSRRIAQVA